MQPDSEIQPLDAFQWLINTHITPAAPFHCDHPAQADLVSVIIPAYKAQAFLQKSVASVWAQTPGHFRVEILICEDGSPDGTLDLARQLQQQSPIPLEVLTHPDQVNLGVSATRNLALRAARGQWIALLDADDLWLPDKLAIQTEFFRNHPQAQCLCSLGRNRDLEGKPVIGWNGTTTAGDFRHVLPPNDFQAPYTFPQLCKGDPIVNSTLLIRRQALEQVGGYPRVMAHQAEDWLLLAKLSLLAPIELLEQELIDYTVHPNSYTTQYVQQGFAFGARLEFLFHLIHWMIQHPQYRQQGEQLFRKEYPRLLAARASAYKLLEDYCRHHKGDMKNVVRFEEHLEGVYAELEQLRLYAAERERVLNLLRKVPGLRLAYAMARKIRH